MPSVSLDLEILAPAERAWDAVVDIESYPDSMTNVRWVKILERIDETTRHCAWSVVLKGSILEWVEIETLDPDAMTMTFHQLSGDLAIFDGGWGVEETSSTTCRVTFAATFEIGIPLLADMLNPVAQRSLRENCIEMLRGVEQTALAMTEGRC